ncbi:MAG: SET domain-containing protein-lysine N-methyltransferase [Gemmatimonadaceae bacterium]|nr:SET domain-containing protein-lysine N-methyltransferase [Gemmatimonadaceae bacterium]
MKVCVLQPDYSTSGVDYRHYDPARDLSRLLPGHTVHHEALHKLSTYRQLKQLSTQGFDIFVNLCEGYLEWDVPSIDVIHSLEALKLPYTGPTPLLYDPPKPLMKYVAHTVGVATPMHAEIDAGALVRSAATAADLRDAFHRATAHLRFPLFVKPVKAGDSLGVDEHAVVADLDALVQQAVHVAEEYPELLVEEYIDGREFTVLVVGDPAGVGHGEALTPVEYNFPAGFRYKSYALKTSELHPEANVPVRDATLASKLRDAALRIFRGFSGVGYARMDFRMDAQGRIFFLEVNFTCSVFYAEGSEGSADHILRHDGIGQTKFLERIIAEGIARHRRRARAFTMRGNAIAGYGIVATRTIAPGEVLFRGEERTHRLVTRHHVERTWDAADRLLFEQYAFPVGTEVYAIWDDDPNVWAPQNHSCDANTAYHGLDVVATRQIIVGEELTLDYGELLDEHSAAFDCRCGAKSCRGKVQGKPGNSIDAREQRRRLP